MPSWTKRKDDRLAFTSGCGAERGHGVQSAKSLGMARDDGDGGTGDSKEVREEEDTDFSPYEVSEILLQQEQRRVGVQGILMTLTEKEEYVLTLRFGFSGEKPLSLRETGERLGVTKERIRQIEAKAMRRLRHYTRSSVLRPYL